MAGGGHRLQGTAVYLSLAEKNGGSTWSSFALRERAWDGRNPLRRHGPSLPGLARKTGRPCRSRDRALQRRGSRGWGGVGGRLVCARDDRVGATGEDSAGRSAGRFA